MHTTVFDAMESEMPLGRANFCVRGTFKFVLEDEENLEKGTDMPER